MEEQRRRACQPKVLFSIFLQAPEGEPLSVPALFPASLPASLPFPQAPSRSIYVCSHIYVMFLPMVFAFVVCLRDRARLCSFASSCLFHISQVECPPRQAMPLPCPAWSGRGRRGQLSRRPGLPRPYSSMPNGRPQPLPKVPLTLGRACIEALGSRQVQVSASCSIAAADKGEGWEEKGTAACLGVLLLPSPAWPSLSSLAWVAVPAVSP